jgi:hypothetical protein
MVVVVDLLLNYTRKVTVIVVVEVVVVVVVNFSAHVILSYFHSIGAI